ncbi:MAG: hypothetical protein AAGD96_16790 [Chloroflexota bacterium]
MTDPNETQAEASNSDQELNNRANNSGDAETSKPFKIHRSAKGHHRKNRTRPERENKRESREFRLTASGLQRHFLACQNCCYFLTGIQVIYGRDVNNRFVDEFDGKWLKVPLSREVKDLLHQTFGIRIDQGATMIDFACSLCCRRFLIELEEIEIPKDVNSQSADSRDQERIEPMVFTEPRSREDRMEDWDRDMPMLLFEFKHRR